MQPSNQLGDSYKVSQTDTDGNGGLKSEVWK